jgi:hypothetical protein
MAVRRADLDSFKKDLVALAPVYHVRRFRFVGGEPFLHKDILSFVRAVRESGIAEQVEIVTNGSLLQHVEADLYRAIDFLSVSWYPDARCDAAKIELAENQCRRHGAVMKVKKVDSFRTMQLDRPIEDQKLRGEIFRSCQIAHSWYCQTFLDGRFYLCSRPLFTDAYLERKGEVTADLRLHDGVPLHEPDLLERLTHYLADDRPLDSCNYCLGTVGKDVPWEQMTPADRKSTALLDRRPADSISRFHLRYLLVWDTIERAVLSVFPSLRLSRALNLAKNALIRA